ncbi:hypothetical protein [Sphingomonas daechungensis]|uniref:glucosamine inositolphosphorylceramide transferase family protein n=1 Tax=Sphingomonas daechungensis TaxID=1176646 RepID=UPI003783479A
MSLRIAVIADRGSVQRFALDALDAMTATDEIAVFSCSNTRIRKRWARHLLYYALNVVTVRNRLTRMVPIRSGRKRISKEVEFASDSDGAWQVLPADVIEELRDYDVVLKFGMGLLRVPAEGALPTPILSYHHGDPGRFRGRPAGFWEIDEGASAVGQVVQVIGNRLDAGRIVAFAETKVFPWSYRRTLIEAYRHSPLLIDEAIRNAVSGTYAERASDGRNYRLPLNATVFGFVAGSALSGLRRIAYGALAEKAWRVSTSNLAAGGLKSLLSQGKLPPAQTWTSIAEAPQYAFYADPFFTSRPPAILVEGLRKSSGLGEIVRIDSSGHAPLIREPGHVSYPSVLAIDGRELLLPEVANWSEPRLYESGTSVRALRIAGGARITDPTLIEHEGWLYLFGNDRRLGSNVLQLWLARSLDDEFQLHPASPIRISPAGSRMGGNLIRHEGRMFRPGQDLSKDYGDGLILFEIDRLTPQDYLEHEITRIGFTDRKGPHTLNVRGDEIVFDWYRDRISPLAGLRRVKLVLQRRRKPQATQ